MSELAFSFCIFGMWMAREIYHSVIQRDLINKVMSRDFRDYTTTVSASKPVPAPPKAPSEDEWDNNPNGYMSGFGSG